MRDSDYILDNILSIMQDSVNRLDQRLVKGAVSDYNEYKYNIGYRKAIDDMQLEIKHLMKGE